MNKKWIFWIKVLAWVGMVAFVGWQIHTQWNVIARQPPTINWAYVPAALGGFAGVMLTSGLVWIWMARQMGDRSPFIGLLGAYVFSQMFKYVPGKVALLFARIDRAGRLGMDARVVTLSTLLENLIYMASGASVGAATVGWFYARENPGLSAGMLLMVVGILAACHPKIFYVVVNKALVKFKRPPVDAGHQLSMWKLLLAMLMFMPCWIFGGLAVWGSIRCFTEIRAGDELKLPGAFAAAVIGGMAGGLPGGLGLRDLIMGLLLGRVLVKPEALLVSVAIQRLFQVTMELLLGVIGMGLTAKGKSRIEKAMVASGEAAAE